MTSYSRASLLRYPLVVDREQICYLSWTVDAYEGLGFLRTDDAGDAGGGRVSLLFTSDYRGEVEALLDALIAEGMHIERGAVEVEEQ